MCPADAAAGIARHGTAAPRDLDGPPRSRGARFGRLFAFIAFRDPGAPAIEALARALATIGDGDNNRDIPAGYTYLAQFVDHDITFDATSQLQSDDDAGELPNFRTPRFDLDSVYGSGPVDQPFLYDWSAAGHAGAKLLVTENAAGGPFARLDLPRNEQGRALIGDPRNDENLIVSQLQLLFLRFHNKVVEIVAGEPERLARTKLFEEARRRVRWHYQWIVVNVLLAKLLGHPPPPRLGHDWRGEPFIPLEFSAAAYRFGHSMVRPTYKIGDHHLGPDRQPSAVGILAGGVHTADDDHLNGFRRLPAALEITWSRFFATGANAPQSSLKIDEHLAAPLHALPAAFARELPPDEARAAEPPQTTDLARLNLLRGRALKLPAGPDVARAVGAEPLTRDQLFPPPAEGGVVLPDDVKDTLTAATPLWYYLLREASSYVHEGRSLGPVGGQIVADVFHGLLDNDRESYVHERPAWRPTLFAAGEHPMADLVNFVEDDA
jgi:hypothetical protein